MYSNNGYIFRFKPTKSQSAREIVAGLLVFLKGIWQDHLDTEKFNKFFMASAIKRAEDAWWDKDNHCIVTKADNELDQIMDQDQDLFFLDRAVEVDMSNTDTSNKQNNSGGPDINWINLHIQIDSHGNDTKDT